VERVLSRVAESEVKCQSFPKSPTLKHKRNEIFLVNSMEIVVHPLKLLSMQGSGKYWWRSITLSEDMH